MIEDGSVETKSPRPYLREGAQLAGRYTIIREIGRGGYSAVYAARDELVRSLVAIKLLVPPPAIADITRERMRREVQVVRQLTHSHIVPVHDFVDDGERSFIVMRLIDGETVADAVKRHGPLPVDTVLRIVRGIASALASAHRIGVLHRDVKPQNILLDQEGTPLLADFGSAHVATATTLTRTGTIIGTVGYLAPNVAAGGRADARDDLYALGMTAVFALTGQLPGRGPRGSVIDRATGTGVRCGAERPDLPPWFEEVIASLTAPDPRDRVPTCDRLLAVLGREQYAPRVAYDEERCLVCGEPDALGHAVCDVCAHVESDVADTLLIIRGEDHALARVPAAVADAAVERLRSRGRDAVALPATRAWTVIPRGTMVLAMLVIASGAAAVRAGVAESYVTPVIIAMGLLFLAERGLRRARPPRRSLGSLPVGLNGIAVQTLSEVRSGTARALVSSLTAAVRLFYGLLPRYPALAATQDEILELYPAACRLVRDVDGMDRLLDAWEQEDAGQWSAAQADQRTALSRRREEHVLRLLDAVWVVHGACDAALSDTAAVDDLAACVDEVRRATAAADDIAALLRPAARRPIASRPASSG